MGLETATIIAIGVAVTATAGAVTAGVQIQGSRIQGRIAKIQAGQAELQAENLEVQAQAEKTAAAENELRRQEALDQVIAEQNAAFAGSGLAATSGSFLAITKEDVRKAAEQKKLASVFQDVRQSGFRVNIFQTRSQAATTRAAGRISRRLGLIRGSTTLLRTGGQLASS